MKRRSLLFLAALSPLAFLRSRYLGANTSKPLSPAEYREQAQKLNNLAANIHTPADARRLIDFISEQFADTIPYRWKSSTLRDQIAQAEFAAVSNPQNLIPDARLAQAWNTYAATIGAPEDQRTTPTEIHYLRDGFQITARALWDRGSRTLWTVPSIYATQPGGQIASGSRAIEAIRVLHDLAKMPSSLQWARDRVRHGTLFSDEFRTPRPATAPSHATGLVAFGARINAVEIAQRNYIQRNGDKSFSKVVLTLLNDTLTA